jgi:small subunit ribosomal protein S6
VGFSKVNMKKYELMTIYKVSLGEDGARNMSNKVKDVVSANGGKVLDSNLMGKRRFAYEINKEKEGYYDVITLETNTETVKKLKDKLNLTEGLIRYLITAK